MMSCILRCARFIVSTLCFLLRAQYTETETEIAKLLGISQSSVSRYLNRRRAANPAAGCPPREFVEEILNEMLPHLLTSEVTLDEVVCTTCLAWKKKKASEG